MKTLNIERPSNDTIVWAVKPLQDKVYDIVVPNDCKLLEINNGVIVGSNSPNRYEIKRKKYDKTRTELSFVACYDSDFSIMVGVGGIPYEDKKRKIVTEFGCNGTFKVRVISPKTLYRTFNQPNVKNEDVQKRILETIRTAFSEIMFEFVEETGGYGKINSELTYISKKVTKKMRESGKFTEIGLSLIDFTIGNRFMFKDDYLNAVVNGTEEENFQKFLDRAAKINQTLGTQTAVAQQPEVKAEPVEKTTERRCQHCGNVVGPKDKMCPICGRFI